MPATKLWKARNSARQVQQRFAYTPESIDPADPIAWLTHHRHNTSQPKPQPAANNPIGPTGYDTAIDHDPAYQDGSLHIRKGWARR